MDAFRLLEKTEKYIPQDPKLGELQSLCSVNISVQTIPPGVNIYAKEYKSPESDWLSLGVSPINDVRMPIGIFIWNMEKEGYMPVTAAQATFEPDMSTGKFRPKKIMRILDEEATAPSGMVRVLGGEDLDDFFIDKYEVTNRQYKEFIDRGGYQRKEYWKNTFVNDGQVLTWENAIALFKDATGRPGPATWQAGDYPDGEDESPVTGVSWYEATAYAEFAGKRLPTIRHWDRTAGTDFTSFAFGTVALLASRSRFGGDRPAAVGSYQGVTSFGAYDMAGNVREWCWNETPKGRCIRGGAWTDVMYMFRAVTQAPPFDRSPQNGFRCVQYLDINKIPVRYFQQQEPRKYRDFYKEKPVSDDIFQSYKERFSYDKTDLNSRTESRDESPEDWIKEKISFDAAYDKDRVLTYLFLPKNAPPPFQTVIYFPSSVAVFRSSSEDLEDTLEFRDGVAFIIKNRRAVLYPVYKGTHERTDDIPPFLHNGNDTHGYTEYLIKIVKDFKRSLDYLETRQDIDHDKFAFYGTSWGAFLGSVIPAVEDRLKVSIINAGGFPVYGKRRSETDEINYVSRVKIPTLMLNGIYDFNIMPVETAARPMFNLLGTPDKDKDLRLFESDHIIPKNELIKNALAWLDKYLGPVAPLIKEK